MTSVDPPIYDMERSRTQDEQAIHFSLASLFANILNPVPMTKTVFAIMSREDEFEELENRNDALHDAVNELHHKVTTLESELDITNTHLKLCKGKINIRDQMIKRMEQEQKLSEECNMTHQVNHNRLSLQFQQNNIVLEDQLEETKHKLSHIQCGLDQYKKKYQDSTDQTAKLQNELSQLQANINKKEQDKCENDIELLLLKFTLDKLQLLCNEKTQRLTVAEDTINTITVQNNMLHGNLCETQQRLDLSDETREALKAQTKILEEQLQVKSELAMSKLVELTGYKDNHSFSNADVCKLKQHIYVLEYEVEECNAVVSYKSKKLKTALCLTQGENGKDAASTQRYPEQRHMSANNFMSEDIYFRE